MTENVNDNPTTQADEGAQDNPVAASPEERIAELEAQLAEAQATVLYTKAEGENIRRRAMDDIEKARLRLKTAWTRLC
jgi:molecular chaperone GrpE